MKRRLFILVISLILALGLALPVLAHAELLRSIPEANAELARPPVQVELFFSEALEPAFSSVTVLDSSGQTVDSGDSRVNPLDSTHLTVSVRSLPDGVYTVAWKALSAVDGHVTTGAYPFAVGDVDAADLAAADQASRRVKVSLTEIVARWLMYIAATALTGGTLFVSLVWTPVYRRAETAGSDDPLADVWRRLAIVALALLVAANILGLLVQAGQAAGGEIAAPWSEAVGNVLFNTRFGALWIARLALSFAAAALLPSADSARERWIAFGLCLLILLTISLGSHAAAEGQPVIPIAADWVHMVAASAWVGGLTHFVAAMWAARQFEPRRRTGLTAGLIPRFSALALTSVGALVLTGLYASVLRLGSLEALTSSIYGRTLAIKLIIALPMLALGAVNLLGITPAVKKALAAPDGSPNPAGLADRFRAIITSEVTLGMVLLLSVGVLTSLPPTRSTATAQVLSASQQVDDLTLELDITPGRVGLNTFTVVLTSEGQPVTGAREVMLRFTPASGRLPPSEVVLAEQGGGKYSIKGSYLSLPDAWQIQTAARREGKFDAYANFDLSVGTSTAGQGYPWHRISGGLLLFGALAYLFALNHLSQTQTQLIGLGIVPALVIAVASVLVFYRPPVVQRSAEVINPNPPNPPSRAPGAAQLPH
jgi:copper transport protein